MELKKIRENKGITACKVYNALGIDSATFKSFEDGKASMRVEWLPTLSYLYGLKQAEIIKIYTKGRGLNDRKRKKSINI